MKTVIYPNLFKLNSKPMVLKNWLEEHCVNSMQYSGNRNPDDAIPIARKK